MVHLYRVYWPNGSWLQFHTAKFCSMAELQFCVFVTFQSQLHLPRQLADDAMQGFVRVDCAIDPQYWNERK